MNLPSELSTLSHINLGVTGMTCTSCSARVERKLNKMDGVEATVNYATESASVHFDSDKASLTDLIDVVRAAGYDAFAMSTEEDSSEDSAGEHDPLEAAHRAESRDLLQRLWVSALLAIPVVALSMIPAWQFRHWQWAVLVLSTLIYTYGGAPFHRATLINLRHGSTTMDTLVSLGTTAAYLWSLWALFLGNAGEPGMVMEMSLLPSQHSAEMDHIYLESVAVVITFLLLGRWFELKAKGASSAALKELLSMGAQEASVLRDEVEQRIPASQLQVGDIFVVRPGEIIATDGIITEGHSAIDESMLSGESVPVEAAPGDSVTGATLNTNGRLLVRATRVGKDTTLARMAQLVSDAQAKKAPIQRLVDRISAIFVPTVIVVAIITLAVHLSLGHSATWSFSAAVAVLIIACPCALGLATPTALLVGTSRGAQLGLLIKGPEVLESTRRVNTIVLDKTGTLTEGNMTVSSVHGAEDTLILAAATESGSEHPIAHAIVRAAESIPTETFPTATSITAHPGVGVVATVEGQEVSVGKPSSTLPPALADAMSTAQAQGATAVAVEVDGEAIGVIVLRDRLKNSAVPGVAQLHELGLESYLLSGDNEPAARAVASEVGIKNVIAEVLPQDKASHVEALQAEGRVVAMVGDGVNDAPALAQADVGLAMGAGTDVAIEASDITLMNNDVRSAADALRLARRTLWTIRGNLFWAFSYNVVLIPVAAFGVLNPGLAGIAMAMSSVFVVGNSLTLRGFNSTPASAATRHSERPL